MAFNGVHTDKLEQFFFISVVVQRYSFVLSLIIDGVCTGKGK
jgi:hypothetical protein